MKTAQQAASNWQQSAGRAATAYVAGVQGFTGDWAGATIAQEAVMVANFQQAIASGAFTRGVQAVGTSGWKAATEAKSANYSTGFQAGANNQSAAITKIMSALGNIVPSLPPRGTYEQNKVRATSLMDQLHALNGTLGAR
jgi:hypothetical protein